MVRTTRRPSLLSPGVLIFRKSLRDGIFGNSRFWKAAAFVILGRRLLRRLMGAEPRTVAVEKLVPGQTLILRGVTERPAKRR